MTTVFAVDPGGTTGLAYANFGTPGAEFRSYERETWEAVRCVEVAISWPVSLVVAESFIPRPGVRSWEPDAIESIGAIRYLCLRARVPFELQTPAEGKRFGTNEKLKLLGWKNASKGGHRDDAARHLLVACIRHNLLDPAQFAIN